MAKSTVTLTGVVGNDPERRATAKGDVVKFRLGVNERKQDASGAWIDGPTSWFQVDAWNQLGSNTAASVRKGQRVLVHGVLSVREFSGRDGSTARSAEVKADSIGHDLTFGTSRFERVTKQQAAPATEQAQRHAAPPVDHPAPVDHSNEWAPPGTTEPAMALDDVETPF